MCTRPVFISKPRSGIDSLFLKVVGHSVWHHREYYTRVDAHQNQYNSLDGEVERRLRPTHWYGYTVPCGKCAECMKAKSNDLAIRSYLEARKMGSMHFLTLTYNDVNLPFSRRIVMTDKSTGEIYSDFKSLNLSELDYRSMDLPFYYFTQKFEALPASRNPRYVYFGGTPEEQDKVKSLIQFPFYDDGYEYGLMVTPSLQRRDVQLWLKRCRINYEREFHEKCPKFSYVCVGEYGPKTCRPHYHVALYGLRDRDAKFFAHLWEKGFSKCVKVNLINKDKKKSNGWIAASKYIAKYMAKGVFECPSVKDGYAIKGRIQSSIEFGIDLTQSEIDKFRCYDLVGRFDINRVGYSLVPSSVEVSSVEDLPFTIDDLRSLHEEVKRRQKIELDGFKYNLPKNVIKRIWFFKDGQGVWHPSAIQRIFTSFIQSDFLGDFIEEFRQSHPDASREDICQAISDFTNMQYIINEEKEKSLQKTQLRFFNKSLF